MKTLFTITLLLFFIIFSSNAQDKDLEKEIIKITAEIKNNYEYITYGREYAKAIEENKPIPKPTFLEGEENKLLKEVMKSIQISLDEFDRNFEFKFPEINGYPEDLKARSQVHKLMFESLTYLDKTNDKCINYTMQLEQASKYIVEIKQITNELQKLFIEIHDRTGQGFTELSSIYGYRALGIENFTKPQLNKIGSSLKKLIEKVQKERETVLQKRTALTANMQILLKNQEENLSDSLKYYLDQQKILDGKAKLLNAKLNLNAKKISLRQEKLSGLKTEKENLIQLKAMIDENKSNAGLYKTRLASKESQLKGLSFCPNNKPWEECTHSENKRQYTTNKRSIENEISTLHDMITEAENYVREMSPRYAHRARSYNNSLDMERDKLHILQDEKKELDNKATEIATDYLIQASLVNKYQELTIQCETHLSLLLK